MTGIRSEAGRRADPPDYSDDRRRTGVGNSGSGGGPGSWGPGGWGPGGFGGPGGHGGRGRRDLRGPGARSPDTAGEGLERLRGVTIGGRRDLRAAVLLLLDEWPMRESQLVREISERSGSAWIVDDASIAGALASLEYAEIAGNSVVDGHRVNHLTRRGIDYVEQHRDDLGSPWDDVENSAEEHDRRERTSAENQARRRESPEDEPPDPDATAGD